MTNEIDHIGIAVENLDEVLGMYKNAFGMEAVAIERYEALNTKMAIIPAGEIQIHLLSPIEAGGGPIAEFLEEKGEGFHHVGLRVEDIEGTRRRLKQLNMPLQEEEPVEVGDFRILFNEPSFTQNILFEIMERSI